MDLLEQETHSQLVGGNMFYNIGYNSKSKGYKSNTKCYKAWNNMLKRCYDEDYHKRSQSYSECYVCDEWKDFQNFAEWYYNNIYELGTETMCLDKDLLVKGNKIYSPETCVILPETLNKLLINTSTNKGKYLTGVSYHKHTKKFTSFVSLIDKRECLGYFDTEEEAFEAYKSAKEQVILKIAELYKDFLPHIVYKALLNYKI